MWEGKSRTKPIIRGYPQEIFKSLADLGGKKTVPFLFVCVCVCVWWYVHKFIVVPLEHCRSIYRHVIQNQPDSSPNQIPLRLARNTFGSLDLSQSIHCGGFNKNGPHELIYLNACWVIREWHWLRRSRRYSLVGIGVALLEEVCHWGRSFKSASQVHIWIWI